MILRKIVCSLHTKKKSAFAASARAHILPECIMYA